MTAESLGACPPDYVEGIGGPDLFALPGYFVDPDLYWMELTPADAVNVFSGGLGTVTRGVNGGSWITGFEAATIIRGEPIDTLLVPDSYRDQSIQAADAEATLLVAYRNREVGFNSVRMVVAILSGGELAVVGACAFRYRAESLRRVHQAAAPEMSGADFIRSLTADLGWAQAAFDILNPPSPGWKDQDPALRQMEAAPRSVLKQYREIEVYFDASDAWWSLGSTLCTKNPMGWNNCTMLTPGLEDDPQIDAWVLRNGADSVEVWLLDNGLPQRPIGLLGAFEVAPGGGAVLVRLSDATYTDTGDGPWIVDVQSIVEE